MENRSGLIVDAMLTQADGTAEREAALLMLYSKWRESGRRGARGPATVAADKAYDTRDFVRTVREMNIGRTCRRTRDVPGERYRRPHHAACGLCREPAQAAAN